MRRYDMTITQLIVLPHLTDLRGTKSKGCGSQDQLIGAQGTSSVKCHAKSQRVLHARAGQSSLRTLSASGLSAPYRSHPLIVLSFVRSVLLTRRESRFAARKPRSEGDRTARRTLQSSLVLMGRFRSLRAIPDPLAR